MNNYFDRELLALEKELLWLKTSSQKSSSLVETTSQTIPISVNLELGTGSSDPFAVAVLYYEIVASQDALIIPTLDWYYADITQAWRVLPTVYARYIDMKQIILPNGNNGIKFTVFGTNMGANNDAHRVAAGETITISFNLTVRCTTNFTLRRYQ